MTETVNAPPTSEPKIVAKQMDNKLRLDLVPMKFLEYLSLPLAIGIEKGYTEGSWMKAPAPNRQKRGASKRHLLGVEEGTKGDKGDYTEYKLDGTPCTGRANHYAALAFNALWELYCLEKGQEDDR
jgi:hypothetical protein